MGSALLPSPFRRAKSSGSVRYAVIGSRSFRFPSHRHRGSCPWLVLRLKIALTNSPPRRAGVARSAGVVSSAKSRTCRSDHPVCAAFGGFAPSYFGGASSPPLRGGECGSALFFCRGFSTNSFKCFAQDSAALCFFVSAGVLSHLLPFFPTVVD